MSERHVQAEACGKPVDREEGPARAAPSVATPMDSVHQAERDRLLRKRGPIQHLWDLIGAPFRMVVLPDAGSRRLGLSSLEDERLRAVLPTLRGRVLDIGAGTNRLMQLCGNGVGVDVIDWGGGALVVEDTRRLPFEDATFDTVCFVACLNHIPYREAVLSEARRLLRPGGRVVVTMIGRLIGEVGHKIWWYSEDKHREVEEGELMGMPPTMVLRLLEDARFRILAHTRFLYGLNHLFVAQK